jgi:uncharacterized protein YecT (DUF1311 family)
VLGSCKAKKVTIPGSTALLPCRELLFIALITFRGLSLAQQDGNVPDAYAAADSQLNAVYQQVLPRFTLPNQEIFRRAELAWIDFSNKQKALVNRLQNENLVPNEFANADSIVEVNTRSKHLQTFFLSNNIPIAQPYMLQNLDQALNKTYTACFRRMSQNDQGLLVSSGRAWITYRNADAASVMAAYNNQTVETAAAAQVTAMRNAQLISLMQSVRPAPTTNTPAQEMPSPLQNSSPNPEDISAVFQFKDEAKGVLNAFLAKKDDPFFKNADAIKNIPELPAEISTSISKLDTEYIALSQKSDSARLLEPALNECRAVELLSSWSKFRNLLKTGHLDEAGSLMEKMVSQKPTGFTADYLPLWQTVESWQKVYLTDKSQFDDHIEKAQSSANLGQTSVAIKEYQAAYNLIEDATIPEKIKKLQEQSLGL